jgi:quinol monooxygenase YgiN
MNRRDILKSAGGLAAGAAIAGAGVAAAASPSKPVAFTVIIEVKPGHEDEFLRLLTPVLDAMRHETTFINAALHRDPEDPARFMIYETWADLDDVVQVQIRRDYRKAYLARLPEILREDRQIATWQPMRADFTFSTGQRPAG